MCGIVGVIGKSKNPQLSYKILTALFKHSEPRGKDASGFWASTDKKIMFHKEQGSPTFFVGKERWKKVEELNPDLMILHARASSIGVGGAYTNKNNHPFLGSDKTIALTHNGRVEDSEYEALKKRYEVKSSCDSEILIRVYENFRDSALKEGKTIAEAGLHGVSSIWSYAIDAKMAVAIAERPNEKERYLWIFRNRHRPLWVADCTAELGQWIYVSEDDIWYKALKSVSSDLPDGFMRKVLLREVKPNHIWFFKYSADNNVVTLDRFAIKGKFGVTKQSIDNIPMVGFKEKDCPVEFDCVLNKDDEVPYKHNHSTTYNYQNGYQGAYQGGDNWEGRGYTGMVGGHSANALEVTPPPVGKARSRSTIKNYPHYFDPDDVEVISVDDDKKKIKIEDKDKDKGKSPDILFAMESDNVENEEEHEKVQDFFEEVEKIKKDLEGLLNDVHTRMYNKMQEGSLTEASVAEALDSLTQMKSELTSLNIVLD